MALTLKILSGPQAGRSFSLKLGMLIGRAESDITISDPKISGRHAKIESDPDGNLVAVDLGSTNGMRVGGKRMNQVVLTPGVIVKIGGTDCTVEAPGSVVSKSPPPVRKKETKTNNPPEKLPPVPQNIDAAEIEASPISWSEFFSGFSERAQTKVKSKPRDLYPFKPLLILTAIKGLHMGQEWSLGYGPRAVGSMSLDLNILEPDQPGIAFTVSPQGREAKFETNSPDKVRLNGETKKTEMLKEGDVIQIDNIVLRVSFKE